jgi:hypothetical protein
VSLPDEAVFPLLEREFVLGWFNTEREWWVGESFGYSRQQSAVGTSNGAGPHNVQIFVLSPDLVVMHALAGYWHPEDLVRELRLGLALYALWRDDRSLGEKYTMYKRMQLAAVRAHPAETYARSGWQDFDVAAEVMRLGAGEARDTIQRRADGTVARGEGAPLRMKPMNVLLHERMAARPFVPFAAFDIAAFVDYGRPFYDNNLNVDGQGRRFVTMERLKAKRARAEARGRS